MIIILCSLLFLNKLCKDSSSQSSDKLSLLYKQGFIWFVGKDYFVVVTFLIGIVTVFDILLALLVVYTTYLQLAIFIFHHKSITISQQPAKRAGTDNGPMTTLMTPTGYNLHSNF